MSFSSDSRTDSGWIGSTSIVQLAQIAVAGINTAAAIKMAKMQYDIADGYLQLAKEMRDYWNTTFKPCEQAMVMEACSAPLYDPQYLVTAGRYVASVRQQFRKKFDDTIRCTPRYCTGLTAQMSKDLALAEGIALGSAMNYAYRYEEARKEAKDDLRWKHRDSALALGRNLVKDSGEYARMAAGMFNTLGQQAGAGASGALKALGHDQNRIDPSYPTRSGGSYAQDSASMDALSRGVANNGDSTDYLAGQNAPSGGVEQTDGLSGFLSMNDNFSSTPSWDETKSQSSFTAGTDG